MLKRLLENPRLLCTRITENCACPSMSTKSVVAVAVTVNDGNNDGFRSYHRLHDVLDAANNLLMMVTLGMMLIVR